MATAADPATGGGAEPRKGSGRGCSKAEVAAEDVRLWLVAMNTEKAWRAGGAAAREKRERRAEAGVRRGRWTEGPRMLRACGR